MWKEKLEAVKQEMAVYDDEINDGITEEEAVTFKLAAEEALHFSPPEEYVNVLKIVNGVEFNGFILYGVDEPLLHEAPNQYVNGFIDNNEVWHENEWEKPYVFIGDSSISWYAYDQDAKKYYELDKPSGTEYRTFESLEELLEQPLGDSLL